MPVGYMVWGGAAGLAAGGVAMAAGMGTLWAVAAYALIGTVVLALVSIRV